VYRIILAALSKALNYVILKQLFKDPVKTLSSIIPCHLGYALTILT